MGKNTGRANRPNRNQTKKSGRKFPTLVILAAVCLIGIIAILQNSEPSPEPQTVSTPHAEEVSPVRHVNTVNASPEQVQHFEEFLQQGRQLSPPVQPQGFYQPFTNPLVLAKIHQARELVIRQAAPSGAWKWREVQEVIAQIGGKIPLYQAKHPETDPTALIAHVALPLHFEVWPNPILEDISAEDLAPMMVHEATHVVTSDELRKLALLSNEEIDFLTRICADISRMENFTQEALSFYNQNAFMRARPEGIKSSMLNADDLRGVTLAEKARAGAPDEFVTFLEGYAEISSRETEALNPGFKPGRCGPIIRMNGPRRGQYVYLTELAPGFLDPLFRGMAMQRRFIP